MVLVLCMNRIAVVKCESYSKWKSHQMTQEKTSKTLGSNLIHLWEQDVVIILFFLIINNTFNASFHNDYKK